MKVICLDWGYYIHTSIFSKQDFPSAWLCTRMLIGDLKRLGVREDDIVIVAVDNHEHTTWRKLIDTTYKANRAALRQATEIDWKKEYASMDRLRSKLEQSTPLQFISLCSYYNDQIVSLEADDIAAIIPTHFSDKEVILVSCDQDWEQLCVYDNVKIYSPKSKKFKIVTNPEAVLVKKILGKEISDNLHTIVASEIDYERRKKIVSLLELPYQIEDSIKKSLDILEPPCYNINMFPYEKLKDSFKAIFNSKGITYEQCLKTAERKKKISKVKKEKKKQLKLELT